MIPKIIHFCWFGQLKKTRLVKKCIRSWKKYLPDYQIIEWNEDNYDLSAAPVFVQDAVKAKKWAFAVDYIRYQVIYEHGGIYFDTDVEVLKNFDSFRRNKAFFGFEDKKQIASGLGFGAEKGTPILQELMNNYINIPFLLADGQYDLLPCPERDTPVFIEHGFQPNGKEQVLDGDIHIYPSEYFCPFDWYERKLRKTKNTAAIHWYAMSWVVDNQHRERWNYFMHSFKNTSKRIVGMRNYERLSALVKGRQNE